MPETAAPSFSGSSPEVLPLSLPLELIIEDRETIQALLEVPEGALRDDLIRSALKIGIVALKQASGRLDAELIQREGAELLRTLQVQFRQHAEQLHDRVGGQLREYFDPESGRFNERVKRLVSRDGELQQLLRQQIGGEDSELAKTLLAHVGGESPLMKLLSPTESEGLLGALRVTVDEQLQGQRERLLKEFSLDNPESSLTRLVSELTKNHGELQAGLKKEIDGVVKEFSLDEENSALSRLVRNVDAAQKTISQEFSLDNDTSAFSRLSGMLRETQGAVQGSLTLDNEDSPLARLKRELLQLLKDHSRENRDFREEVKVALAKLVTQRGEQNRSTRHGIVFEEAVGELVIREAQRVSDVAEATGKRPGKIPRCLVGDFVIELGPESPAPGAKMVVEAKEDRSYSLSKAREELEQARKNRDAELGVFVFSGKTAPPNLEPFARYGSDLIVVWDAEDASTDVYLKAALTAARALAVRTAVSRQEQSADVAAIETAVLKIEKTAEKLSEIQKYATTIHSSSEKILNRVRIDQDAFRREITLLTEKVAGLKRQS